MRGLYNNAPVTVVDQSRMHWLIQLGDGELKLVPLNEVEFECESLLDWVRSDAWLKGVPFEEFRRAA